MSDENETVEYEVITPSIEDMLDAIKGDRTLDSGKIFADLMSGKIEDALEQEKIRIADAVYNSDGSDDEEEFESDVEDESDVEEVELELEDDFEDEVELELEDDFEDEVEDQELEDDLSSYDTGDEVDVEDEIEYILAHDESED